MTCPSYIAPFQPQNPALSHDSTGWLDCTAFAAAMAADFDSCGKVKLTGHQVRAESNEPTPDPTSPGLNLSQVADVLHKHGVELEVRYNYPWADFERRIDGGAGAILQLQYAPIRASFYVGDKGFSGGHAIFVPPGWAAEDPLCDGRWAGIYKYRGDPYPRALLRQAAGALLVGAAPRIRPIGLGLVYAAFTRSQGVGTTPPKPLVHTLTMAAGEMDWWAVTGGNASRKAHVTTGGFTATCSVPKLYLWPGHTIGGRPARVSLVQVLSGSGNKRYLATRAPRLTLKET